MKFYCVVAALGLCIAQGAYSETKIQAKLPQFTPFNWADSPTGYIIQGQICNTISNVGLTGCGPATFVIDPRNKRMMFDLGVNGGTHYILQDTSYINGAVPGACLQIPGFTFDDQVAGYANVLSMPDSAQAEARYFGRAVDAGGCKDKIATELLVKSMGSRGNVITQFNFVQMYPIQGLGCQYVTGSLVFKIKSVDFFSDKAPYFVLPPSCNSSAPSFCEIVYPVGNACGL